MWYDVDYNSLELMWFYVYFLAGLVVFFIGFEYYLYKSTYQHRVNKVRSERFWHKIKLKNVGKVLGIVWLVNFFTKDE